MTKCIVMHKDKTRYTKIIEMHTHIEYALKNICTQQIGYAFYTSILIYTSFFFIIIIKLFVKDTIKSGTKSSVIISR